MFESKSGVLLIGGLGFFAFAFLSNALVPALMYRHLPEATVTELVEKNSNVMYQFEDLSRRYPEAFKEHFGEPTMENCAEALWLGRQTYVNEGCWHCHSQFVRPVSCEEDRWGPVSKTAEYQNELQRPVMFGTRRVGPDLSREGGCHGNDCMLGTSSSRSWSATTRRCPTIPGCSMARRINPTAAAVRLPTCSGWDRGWKVIPITKSSSRFRRRNRLDGAVFASL